MAETSRRLLPSLRFCTGSSDWHVHACRKDQSSAVHSSKKEDPRVRTVGGRHVGATLRKSNPGDARFSTSCWWCPASSRHGTTSGCSLEFEQALAQDARLDTA